MADKKTKDPSVARKGMRQVDKASSPSHDKKMHKLSAVSPRRPEKVREDSKALRVTLKRKAKLLEHLRIGHWEVPQNPFLSKEEFVHLVVVAAKDGKRVCAGPWRREKSLVRAESP